MATRLRPLEQRGDSGSHRLSLGHAGLGGPHGCGDVGSKHTPRINSRMRRKCGKQTQRRRSVRQAASAERDVERSADPAVVTHRQQGGSKCAVAVGASGTQRKGGRRKAVIDKHNSKGSRGCGVFAQRS
jgi:hypothetical protein